MNRRADDDHPPLPVDIEQLPEHVWFAFTQQVQGDVVRGAASAIIAAALECCLDSQESSDCAGDALPLPRAYELEEEDCLEAAEEEDTL